MSSSPLPPPELDTATRPIAEGNAARSGKLAPYLAEAFRAHARGRWKGSTEYALLDATLARRLAMRPRADLLLTAQDASRTFVEFEVSRADPVANQVKFLVAAQAGAFGDRDVLVCMLSPDIRRGKRSLSAEFGRHLRTAGMNAFTLSLLPGLSPREVRRLNQLSEAEIAHASLPVASEFERVLSVIEPRGELDHRIHFAGDVTDVVANIWAWNDAMAGAGADLWAGRAAQFFAFDPLSRSFAPSKFCAFLPTARPGGPAAPPTMTMPTYMSLGERDPRFDGHRARTHLANRLGFQLIEASSDRDRARAEAFSRWTAALGPALSVRASAHYLVPPRWYAE